MGDQTLTFGNLINQEIMQVFTGQLDSTRVLLTLGLSCVLGLFVLLVYHKTFSGVIYSRSFGFSLVMMTMVTSMIIMPMTANISLSLGMVGALSIIRFRTAVKDAMDTMFMFYGVAVGICLGAGFYMLAVVGALVIALVMAILCNAKTRGALPYLLVLHFRESATADVRQLIAKFNKVKLKSKTVRNDSVEMTVEIRLADGQDGIVDQFLRISGVYDASLISYQGDLVS